MLSDKFIFRPSRLVGVLLAGGAALSVVGALIIPIYAAGRILLALVCGRLFWLSIQRHARLRGEGVIRGLLFRRQDVAILDGDGITIDAGVVSSSFISPMLSVAVIKGRQRRYALLLMPDSLSAEDYRQLRIRLNIATTGAKKRVGK